MRNLEKKELKTALKSWSKNDLAKYKYWKNNYLYKSNFKINHIDTMDENQLQKVYDALEDFSNQGFRIKTYNIAPKTQDHYIGIELECFSPSDEDLLHECLVKCNLHEQVQIGEDGSINGESECNAYELRILLKEKELPKVTLKLKKLIEMADLRVNESCGLHVHLDMRHRNFKECYYKLMKFQNILFRLVSSDRQDNEEYCAYVNEDNAYTRYTAINRVAYKELKTIEVRLHQGCIDTDKIQNWIKLLTKIINQKIPTNKKVFTERRAFLRWLKHSKDLQRYVKTNFDFTWDNKEFDDTYIQKCFKASSSSDDWADVN